MKCSQVTDLNFHTLHAIDEAFTRGAFRGRLESSAYRAEDLLVGRAKPTTSVSFRQDSGKRPLDLIGTTSGATRLASDSFVSALKACGASGWTTFPVKLIARSGLEISGYHGLTVTGRAGPLDGTGTRIVKIPPRTPGGVETYEERGWSFEQSSWDGSDIFVPEGTIAICVVERVKSALEAAKLSNACYTSLYHHMTNLFAEMPRGRALAPE
jgi:hypothetical protein